MVIKEFVQEFQSEDKRPSRPSALSSLRLAERHFVFIDKGHKFDFVVCSIRYKKC